MGSIGKAPILELVAVAGTVAATAVLGVSHILGETSVVGLLTACLAYTFGRAVPKA